MAHKEDIFTIVELENIRRIIGTHPTPEGVASPQGQTKLNLIHKITNILAVKKTDEAVKNKK